MSDSNVIKLAQPGAFTDSLTEILRSGARALLTQAVEAEVAEFLAKHADLKTETGQQRVVRHGHLPEREIMTGIGPVAVRQPRVRDREASRGRAHPVLAIDPAAVRAAVEEPGGADPYPLPEGHLNRRLRGSAGGARRQGRARSIGVDHRPPQGGVDRGACALAEARSVERSATSTCWADGIHLEARLEEQAQCILVIIGATPEGRKELVGFTDGMRESSQSWRDLLLDLKRRGLTTAPQIAVADGALGFWKALGEVWPTTREQRCWVHKTANILNKLPKSLHTKAKRALQEIWMAETKKDAVAALDAFVETYGVKYDKAADCLTKDRDALLAFYDFPAEHWKHLRTTNPIESTFATVRHRTIRSKGCLSNKTALAMVFKLVEGAQKSWRRHRRPQPVAKTDPGCEVRRRDRGHRQFCRASSRRLILQAVTKIRR